MLGARGSRTSVRARQGAARQHDAGVGGAYHVGPCVWMECALGNMCGRSGKPDSRYMGH